MMEDERYSQIVREHGEYNARLSALEKRLDRWDQDMRELRDMIRMQGANAGGSKADLAIHHLADAIAKMQPPAPPPNIAHEITQAMLTHQSRGGGNALAASFGAVAMIALVLAWKLFAGA